MEGLAQEMPGEGVPGVLLSPAGFPLSGPSSAQSQLTPLGAGQEKGD